jgi:sugar lactone lactonase YvrE
VLAHDCVIEVPVSRPRCCTFGGADDRTLFVTSAQDLLSDVLSDNEKQKEMQVGSLYCICFEDVQGLPPNLFAL